jgi:hypothetical protein
MRQRVSARQTWPVNKPRPYVDRVCQEAKGNASASERTAGVASFLRAICFSFFKVCDRGGFGHLRVNLSHTWTESANHAAVESMCQLLWCAVSGELSVASSGQLQFATPRRA